MKEKRIPERRCVGCGRSFPKNTLVRVVRTPEGEVTLDGTGKLNGRGAYLCVSAECFRLARKKNRLATNLSAAIPEEVLDGIERKIKEFESEGAPSE